MKTIKRNLKWAAKILSFIILFQSCTVYHSTTASVDEAIQSSNKVKVVVPGEDPYKFLNLVRIDNEIYGVAKKKSNTSNLLQAQITDTSYQGKYNLIELNDQNLQDIRLMNKGASTALSIVIPVVLVSGVVVISTAAALNDGL